MKKCKMTEKRWAIMDDKGIIYEGKKEEICEAWDRMDAYEGTVEGDLRLIEIHGVMK